MHRFAHLASAVGGASTLLVLVTSLLVGQGTPSPSQAADALRRMRADFAARRYAAVIASANGLLETARAITTPQRVELFQLLAAAYYPNRPGAQKPDSARLPLTALIRLAPDITIAPELSWPGLDSLTERARLASFVVVTRPLPEYTLSEHTTGRLAVVASRPTRFVLTSVDGISGRMVIHDSSAYVTAASLQLRTHDARGPIFTDGAHQLNLWAYDLRSGDSLRVTHRVRAVRNDRPAPVATTDTLAGVDAPTPSVAQTVTPSVAEPTTPRAGATRRRPALLWGGLALTATTVLIAQEARPNDGLRSAFRVDARAFVVGTAMVAATAMNFLTGRTAPQRAPRSNAVRPVIAPPPPPIDTYRVRLQIDPRER